MSERARLKAEKMKQHLGQKYAHEKKEEHEKHCRQNELESHMKEMGLSPAVQTVVMEKFEAKEAEAQKEARKKMTTDDFESLAIIGKGAFGEVRLVRTKGKHPNEIYGEIF